MRQFAKTEKLSLSLFSAPDYDVISVDHSLHKRNIHELSVKAVINGTEREIILQCVKGFLVGKDTKVWLAEKDPSNGNKFKYTLVPNVRETLIIF